MRTRPLEVGGHLLLGMILLDEGAVEAAIESLRRAALFPAVELDIVGGAPSNAPRSFCFRSVWSFMIVRADAPFRVRTDTTVPFSLLEMASLISLPFISIRRKCSCSLKR